MDYKKYEKYINERMRIKAENERRIKEKFSECEKWVADNLIDCGCVFTNHADNLQKQGFKIICLLPKFFIFFVLEFLD